MAKKAFIAGQGDTRKIPESWVLPHHLVGLDRTAEQFAAAGYDPVILQRSMIQSMRDAAIAMDPILEEGQLGDILVFLSTGWGLPGIFQAACNRIRRPLFKGDIRVHLHSNLLPQYPGFVLASAQAQVCRAMGYQFTRDIVLNWNDPRHIARLKELHESGTITRDFQAEYGDGLPGAVAIDVSDREAARRVLQLIDGNIYGAIGVRSMLMHQAGENELLLSQLGINLQDIGANEMRAEADAIAPWRAKDAMNYCLAHGLKVEVAEEIFLRQMQLLLALHNLIVNYSLDFLGYQGQFDLTKYDVAEDMALALLNSRCRPESNGKAIVGATERDFYAAITMRLLQLCVEVIYGIANGSVGFHDLRHLVELLVQLPGVPAPVKRWFVVWLNSGALDLHDLTGRNDTMRGVSAITQNPGYFPFGGAASKGEMVHLDRIVDYPKQEGPRLGTWARLIPKGKNGLISSFTLAAGNYQIMPLTVEQREKEPTLNALDGNWPMGLSASDCPWQIGFGVDCNHLQSVPYDVMRVLAAIAELMGWEFLPLGVGMNNPIPQDASIVIKDTAA